MKDNNKIKETKAIKRRKVSGRNEAELKYSTVFEQSPDGILLIDADGKIIDFNRAAHADLGYTRKEFSKLNLWDIDPVESSEEIRAHIKKTIGKKKAAFEVTHRTKSGQWQNVLVISQTIELSGSTYLHVIWRDITEQKAAERALLESEAKYRDLFENASDAVFVLDAELRYVDVNRKGIELFGYSREELLGRQPFDFVPQEQQPHSAAEFDKLKRTGSYEAFEGRMLAKDGRWIDIEVSSSAIFKDGAFVGSRDIVRDITERKRLEGAMRFQSEIAANIAEGVYLVSVKDLSIVYANPKMEDMFGYAPGEMNGKHVSIINAPTGGDPVQTARRIEKDLTETGIWRGEVLNIRKDGTVFRGLATISKINLPEYGDVYVSLQRDITESKQAEDALSASQKFLDAIFEAAPT